MKIKIKANFNPNICTKIADTDSDRYTSCRRWEEDITVEALLLQDDAIKRIIKASNSRLRFCLSGVFLFQWFIIFLKSGIRVVFRWRWRDRICKSDSFQHHALTAGSVGSPAPSHLQESQHPSTQASPLIQSFCLVNYLWDSPEALLGPAHC